MAELAQEEWDRLLRRQQELEERAFGEGARRFRRLLDTAVAKGQATSLGGAKRLLREGLGAMEAAVTAMMTAPQGRGYGRRHVAARWCEMLGADVASYITLKVILDNHAGGHLLSKTATAIAKQCEDELRYRRLRAEAPHLFRYRLRSFHTSSYTHRARSLNASTSIAAIDCGDITMSPSIRLRVGIKLIDLVLESTGFVELRRTREVISRRPGRRPRVKTQVFLQPAPKTLAWMMEYNTALELNQPLSAPMVVPPLAWGPDIPGGYRFSLRGRLSLIRGLYPRQANQLPVVYEAVNTLQNTAWTINRRILAVVEAIQTAGGGLAGYPRMDDQPPPAKPDDIQTNEEARRAWRKQAGRTKEDNAVERQRRAAAMRTALAAAGVAGEEAIYFPYNLDFRGRVYPVSQSLSPQGNDLSRALLMFADGKAISPSGARWLAIHGANSMGTTLAGVKVGGLTYFERQEWVAQHTQQILAAADAPLEATWWAQADHPFRFLAFCFEWADLIRANERGEEYVSHLPCSMDGSCNGLQHFSALLCDEEGAKATNIIPQDRPQDIYARVADVVLHRLTALADESPVAAQWLGLHVKLGIIDRKLTKRPTMTVGYGSREFGFRRQIEQYLREHPDFRAIRLHFADDDGGNVKSRMAGACALMAQVLWGALEEVVSAAFQGMSWMQAATRGITRQNAGVRWTVPSTGFTVLQTYSQEGRRIVKTVLAGRVYRPRVRDQTDKVDTKKQAAAVAPNVIHSLDAAALMLTVVQAAAEGVEQFVVVHDSYGTLASDCELLARCCRQEFARLYRNTDVIGCLYRELAAQWEDPAGCPAPPEKGTLDVGTVLGSDYFFA